LTKHKNYGSIISRNEKKEKGMDNKIILQNGAGAFLENNGRYLLMLRSSTREIAPNLWSCVGGHMEKHELNDPMETCLREIKEETGIDKDNIYDLNMRYIIIRQYRNVIRQNYIYFGKTNTTNLIETNEGTLHWIPKDELLNKEYTKTYIEMMKHYIQTPDPKKRTIIGIAGKQNNGLKMQWSIIEDFE
jgi:8-oxo-dGTP diphosphatase